MKEHLGHFTHPRTERVLRSVLFVLKQGALGRCVSCAVVIFLVQSYRANAWLPPGDFVLLLAIWAALGVVFGLTQLGLAERRDRSRRCPECGEVVPTHTTWCPSEKQRFNGAA